MTMLVLVAAYSVLVTASPGETRVRVITYNIHHGEGTDQQVDLDRIAAIVREAHPDVVCLQEVDRNLPRTHGQDFPALLAEKLGMVVVFEPNYQFDGGDYGNATLTRLEIVSHENLRLPVPAGSEPRGCLRTTIRVNGREVDVLNTHLGLDAAERKEQVTAILNAVRRAPTILAGDLNEEATRPALKALLGRFRDTAGSTVPPPTCGTKRIDFVLVSGAVDVLSSRVVETPQTAAASDHRPYVADVTVRKPRETPADKGVYDNDDERVTEAIVEGT